MAPIEATLRTQLEDIVRRCLARMAENFQLLNVPPSTIGNTTATPLPSYIPPNEPYDTIPQFPFPVAAPNATLDFFQEPPHLDAEASASAPSVAVHGYGPLPGRGTDSGYGSMTCQCPCHLNQDSPVPSYSMRELFR